MSIRTTVQDQKKKYIRKFATADRVLSEHHRQHKPEKQEEQRGEPSWKTGPTAQYVPP